jgi:lipoate-protein ligase A
VRWRLIPYAEADAGWNMALDEAILEAFITGGALPTLRFYGWSEPAVTIGRLQPISSVPKGWGTGIVRRPTGGRAVSHGRDLTFSLILAAATLGSRVRESYRLVGEAVAEALVSLGVPAQLYRNRTPPESVRKIGNCFELTLDYEVAVEGAKVLGSAQVRRAGAVLQQNSLALSPGQRGPRRRELTEAIVHALEAQFDAEISAGEVTELELQIARRLADNKYAHDGWNLRGASARSN